MQRLATPMVGGLFSAALLTLVVLPAAYVFVNRAWFGNGWAETPEGTDEAADPAGAKTTR
jgi:hypothetical protein